MVLKGILKVPARWNSECLRATISFLDRKFDWLKCVNKVAAAPIIGVAVLTRFAGKVVVPFHHTRELRVVVLRHQQKRGSCCDDSLWIYRVQNRGAIFHTIHIEKPVVCV